jgi:hypothetical protein
MKTLTFKVTDDEDQFIRQEAQKAKTTVSEFLRQRIRGQVTVTVVKGQSAGAPAFKSSGHVEPLTTKDVREMLADFP